MNQFQSFEEILGVIRRRFWVMALIVAAGCAIAVYYALKQTKVYEATSVIQIEAPEVSESLAGAAVRTNDTVQRVKLIEQRLMSRDNLAKVVEKFDLFNEEPDTSISERVDDMRGAIGIEQILTTAQAWIPGGVPSALIISVQLTDPEKARDVANDLMYGVIEAARARSIEQAQGALELFATEEARVAGEIDTLEAQISEFKQANAIYLTEGLAVLREQQGDLNETILNIEQQIATLQSGSQRTRGEVAEQNLQLLEDQQRIVRNRLDEISTILSTAPEIERELNVLERELKRKQDQFTVVTTRKAEAEVGQLLQERQQGSRFEVLETALLPEAPISRSRKQIAMMGGVGSIMAAVVAAVLLELLNPAIRTPSQMERALGMTPVVSVPRVSVRRERIRRRMLQVGGIAAVLLVVPLVLRYLSNRNGVDVPQ